MKIKPICLISLLLLTGCDIYSEKKEGARRVAEGGEWIVKLTEFDEVPKKRNPDGTVETIARASACEYCEAQGVEEENIQIRVGKNPDPYDIGDEALCILKSHPQFADFARLRRGDKVRFEFTDDPIQTACKTEGMFIKLKK